MNAIFQLVERVVDTIDRGIRGGWRRFSDGPLQNFLFVLVLVISGCIASVSYTHLRAHETLR